MNWYLIVFSLSYLGLPALLVIFLDDKLGCGFYLIWSIGLFILAVYWIVHILQTSGIQPPF